MQGRGRVGIAVHLVVPARELAPTKAQRLFDHERTEERRAGVHDELGAAGLRRLRERQDDFVPSHAQGPYGGLGLEDPIVRRGEPPNEIPSVGRPCGGRWKRRPDRMERAIAPGDDAEGGGVVHDAERDDVRHLRFVHFVRQEQAVEALIGPEVLEDGVVVPFETARDRPAVRLCVEDVARPVPRVDERARLFHRGDDGDGDDGNRDDEADRLPGVELLLDDEEALDVRDGDLDGISVDISAENVTEERRSCIEFEDPSVRHRDSNDFFRCGRAGRWRDLDRLLVEAGGRRDKKGCGHDHGRVQPEKSSHRSASLLRSGASGPGSGIALSIPGTCLQSSRASRSSHGAAALTTSDREWGMRSRVSSASRGSSSGGLPDGRSGRRGSEAAPRARGRSRSATKAARCRGSRASRSKAPRTSAGRPCSQDRRPRRARRWKGSRSGGSAPSPARATS